MFDELMVLCSSNRFSRIRKDNFSVYFWVLKCAAMVLSLRILEKLEFVPRLEHQNIVWWPEDWKIIAELKSNVSKAFIVVSYLAHWRPEIDWRQVDYVKSSNRLPNVGMLQRFRLGEVFSEPQDFLIDMQTHRKLMKECAISRRQQ